MNNLSRNSHVRLDPVPESSGAPPEGTFFDAVPESRAEAKAGVVAGAFGLAVDTPLGAAAAGLAGTATRVDANAENRHWRNQFRREPYYLQAYTFGDYAPAYLTGYQGYARLAGKRFDQIERELRIDYEANRANSDLSWLEARPAIRAAWERVEAAAA